jgi:uncharacterized protein (TIGR03663 family)
MGSDLATAPVSRVREAENALAGRAGDLVRPAVLALVGFGLVARLVLLGDRVSHFDEGRVGYWILEYVRTGDFQYRYIIHGPFVQHVDAALFPVLGPSDFTLRLPVAIIGGLLPLWLLFFRDHLRDEEVVAAAFFLVANPVLLYYSRFFRSTIPVAAFAFGAFACFVRFYDTRRPLYAHAAVALVALAFTAKENAAVYVLVWIGAAALLLDHELFRPRTAPTGVAWLRSWWERNVSGRDMGRWLSRFVGHALLSTLLFGAIIVFFYAPRSGTPGGVGLYNAFGNPGLFPEVFDTMIDDIHDGYDYWFGGATEVGEGKSLAAQYAEFLGGLLKVLGNYAAPLVAFALVGVLIERYATRARRNLVMVGFYWGVVSVLGYPLGTDISGAWLAVNALVPLAIPAGVGVGYFYRWGREALLDDDRVSVAVVSVVLLVALAQMGVVGASGVYLDDQSSENELVQYAQPGEGAREALDRIKVASGSDGTDVLVFGDQFVDGDTEATRTPACIKWFNTLSLPWYFGISDSDVSCAKNQGELRDAVERDVPVIVADAEENETVAAVASGSEYERRTFTLRTTARTVVVLVHERVGESASAGG